MLLNKQTGADAQLSLSRPLGHCSSSSSSYHTGDNIPTLCRQLESRIPFSNAKINQIRVISHHISGLTQLHFQNGICQSWISWGGKSFLFHIVNSV